MRDTLSTPNLGIPPKDYDQLWFSQFLRTMEYSISQIVARGPIRVLSINISNLPTSATDLRQGDLWRDGAVVKIVP